MRGVEMITEQHIQEAISRAFVIGVAGASGSNLWLGNQEQDYAVDGRISEVTFRGRRRLESGVHLDFQLKSTIGWKLRRNSDNEEVIAYSLEAKTFNDLIFRHNQYIDLEKRANPLILILHCLPKNVSQDEWIRHSKDGLVVRKDMYWAYLTGPATNNSSSVKIGRAHV